MTPPQEHIEEFRTHIPRLRAFGDAEVQAQLQLTDDQREQIRAHLMDGFQEAKPLRESLAGVQKRTLDKITTVLTDEQKSRWDQMQARQFEVQQEANHRMSQSRPGIRGGPTIRRQHMGISESANPETMDPE